MHYILTDEKKQWCGHTLHRIQYTVDIPNAYVKAGDLGGWIETTNNLSDNAVVLDNAQVYGNAAVSGNAQVYGNAAVYGGKWEHSPLQIQGSRWFCNMATDEIWRMGCCRYSLSEWVARFDEITAENRQEDIKAEYWRYVKLACEMYQPELLKEKRK